MKLSHGLHLNALGNAGLLERVGSPRADLLRKLASRMQADATEEHLQKPGLPAGYTYLGQLVAHDMTKPIDPMFLGLDVPDEVSVTRDWPLFLETLYGDGPIGTPLIYQLSGGDAYLGRNGKLRLGLTRGNGTQGEQAPLHARDVPRLGCPVSQSQFSPTRRGQPVPSECVSGLFGSANAGRTVATEPLLFDPRNDDNLIISQLLTVFIRLHNHLYDAVHRQNETDMLQSFRHARNMTTAIYQQILLEDYFAKILDGRVWRFYRDQKGRDELPYSDPNGGRFYVPPMFKHGAFRMGHAMVHREYKLARMDGKSNLASFLERETTRSRDRLPITSKWVIDFTHETDGFFDTDFAEAGNRSRVFSPSIEPTLNKKRQDVADGLFSQEPKAQMQLSLTYLDLLRAEKTVQSNFEEIRGPLEKTTLLKGSVFKTAEEGQAKMQRWLLRPPKPYEDPLSAAEAAEIAANPPLPFAVTFEAKNKIRLGKLGSALVARTVAPILMNSTYKTKRSAGLALAAQHLNIPEKQLGQIKTILEIFT
ncbi:MAG: peroxidase family protein [Paracoccaceae bacterium]